MTEGQFLSQVMKDKRKVHDAKLLNKLKRLLQSNMLYFFSEIIEQPLSCSVPTRCIDIDENQTLSPHHWVWRALSSDSDVMSSSIFSNGFRLDTETLCVRRGLCNPGSREWLLENLQTDYAPCHTSRRTQCWLEENFCSPIIPNICPPKIRDCNPGWMRDQLNSLQHQRWTERKDNGNIYHFKQWDRQRDWQDILKASGGLGSNQLQFLWMNLIYISRYYHVVLVNICDKVRCLSLFLLNLDDN